MSRQNYYLSRKRHQREKVDEEFIVMLVKLLRYHHPRMGGRKLGILLKEELREAGIKIGRDRFFKILRKYDLLIEPLPRNPRTTSSSHHFPTYPNLYKYMTLTGPNQVWVADLTYIRTDTGFLYVSIITDTWSRKIVGYWLSESLESSETRKALEMALRDLPPGCFPVHHSDRGCQYCCGDYTEFCQAHGLQISMTESLHCYENALAERVNGILKQEYGLGRGFRTREHARKALREGVELYNHYRPHQALGYRFPSQVHIQAA